MKIALAQCNSSSSDLNLNIKRHKSLITDAAAKGADLICFPELSLSSFSASNIKSMAFEAQDRRLDLFQKMADQYKLCLLVGAPLLRDGDLCISTFIFQANKDREVYSKQILHVDEEPYFKAGNKGHKLCIQGFNIVLGICYETLQHEHLEQAKQLEADIYLAMVVKSQEAIERAFKHYPEKARQYKMIIAMSNAIGPYDNFEGAGQTAIWNAKGQFYDGLSAVESGLLIFDTATI